MSEKIIVTNSEYIISAVGKAQYPTEDLPEIAFAGRSNVGKSSLINSLTRRHNLARISQTPGKTQTINFFKVDLKINPDNPIDQSHDDKSDQSDRSIELRVQYGVERRSFYLVDLPGYGYAKTSKTNRATWAKFIEEYLLKSKRLLFVCLLLDIRHSPMESDMKMFRWLVDHNVPVLPIATKSDKISRSTIGKQIDQFKRAIGIEEVDVLPYSSVKNEGRSELLDAIASSLIQ